MLQTPMSHKRYSLWTAPVVLTLVVMASLLAACVIPQPGPVPGRDTLYQTSTLSALNAGDFDGELTIETLKQYGDFGLGAFNRLDGEMIVLDGQVYQARADGKVYAPDDDGVQTPYAAVTFFEADDTLPVDEPLSCAELQSHLDERLPSLDAPYAVQASVG
jgi:acetolactate decarboxylase